jgi:hypothetical protein
VAKRAISRHADVRESGAFFKGDSFGQTPQRRSWDRDQLRPSAVLKNTETTAVNNDALPGREARRAALDNASRFFTENQRRFCRNRKVAGGITSKGCISPAHVGRITFGMTHPAQSRHVNVPQASFLQRVWKRILVELWVVTGTRHRPHIYHA